MNVPLAGTHTNITIIIIPSSSPLYILSSLFSLSPSSYHHCSHYHHHLIITALIITTILSSVFSLSPPFYHHCSHYHHHLIITVLIITTILSSLFSLSPPSSSLSQGKPLQLFIKFSFNSQHNNKVLIYCIVINKVWRCLNCTTEYKLLTCTICFILYNSHLP